jgi:hypothetical protein
LLLLRHRFHIVTRIGDEERQLLAEDAELAAFAGAPQNPEWLPAEAAEKLPNAEPDGNRSGNPGPVPCGQAAINRTSRTRATYLGCPRSFMASDALLLLAEGQTRSVPHASASLAHMRRLRVTSRPTRRPST